MLSRQVFVVVVLIIASSNIPIQEILIPKASAAPGDGRMLLFWDGGAAPSGWTCVSCTGGDPFYQIFPRANETYGGTGGIASHTHTSTNSIDATLTGASAETQTGTAVSVNSHSHSLSVTVGSSSSLPSYKDLNIIRSNSTGEPTTIPTGAIGLFDDASLPSGWSAYSAENGFYGRGGPTAGATGGSNTHANSLSITIGTATGSTITPRTNGTTALNALASHTHTATGSATSANSEPPYISTIFGKSTGTASPPDGLLTMWDDDQPTNWTKQSGGSGAFYQRFLKGAASFGATGGNSTHTHADNNISSSAAVGTGNYRTSGTGASATHTHNVNVDSYSAASNLPPYRDVIIAKRVPQPSFAQSSYRVFKNTNTTDVGAALSGLNSAATAPRQGTPFRLRLTIHVSVANLDAGNKVFKLQYAARSGTCDTGFSGETYGDVTPSSGDIRYYNNSSPSDDSVLTTNANDPTHSGDTVVAQTYEETNNFTNSSDVINGRDGLWDFSLVDFSSAASASYCFRVVTSADVQLNTYSVIPEIVTDDGNGHMLLFWPGGAVPSGWSCVSCTATDDFYQKFFRGAVTYGATGGSVTHGHTASGSVGTTAGQGIEINLGGTVSTGAHVHTFTPSITDASALPPYRQLQIIRANTSGVPSTIPSGAIAMFDATVPAGWTQYSAQNGNYIRGENTVGSTGGSLTHTHAITGTTGGAIGFSQARTTGGTIASADDGHTHTVNGTSVATNNEPPFIEAILGQITLTGSVPTGIITIWDNPIPGSWSHLSTPGQPFDQKFTKASATYGTTAGSATHTPANSNVTSSTPTPTSSLRGGAGNADGAHTHTVTASSFTSASNLPPYIDVIIAKLAIVNTPPNNPASLDQLRTSDSSSISVGGYGNSSQIEFTATATDTDNPDSLQLCVEVQQIGTPFTNSETQCGSSAGYSGSSVAVDVTISGLSNGVSYHWQARIKDGGGATSSWVSFGANAESSDDFIMDSVDPAGSVYDGTSTGIDLDFNDGSLDSLSANWNITDGGSGISLFEYAIGTTSGGTDIANYSSIGMSSSQTATSLTLETSQIYYFSVRASDNADNQTVITSDGQQVAPSLSFSVSVSGVSFNNLNVGNNYTDDTQTTTFTTSTNARNGYEVRSYLTGLLESALLDTIGNFNGGTYASPDEWLPGDIGYGYTSSDALIQGVNLFQPATCSGGGNGPCFAPFSTTAPGDIVADNQSTVTGTPIINEAFTLTHRVTTDPNQPPGKYQTVLILNATAIY